MGRLVSTTATLPCNSRSRVEVACHAKPRNRGGVDGSASLFSTSGWLGVIVFDVINLHKVLNFCFPSGFHEVNMLAMLVVSVVLELGLEFHRKPELKRVLFTYLLETLEIIHHR